MIKFEPKKNPAYIKVIGVGGGGSNAVNHMFIQGINGVDFVVCNTDVQALESSPVPIKVVLGDRTLGAGSKPEVGKQAAIDSRDAIREAIMEDTQMLFITAGMGGGTGTGAAPVIAEIARELNILTVGIVTLPFTFEGRRRLKQAENGIEEIRKYVDTLLVICNDKLRLLYGDVTLSNAFARADDVLASAAKGIAELITVPGYVNIDFEDVKTVIENSGKAIMGSATAEGENRARLAIEEAMASPLLNDNDIKGARNILLYIMTGEEEIKMDEITEITEYVHEECGGDFEADIIWGNGKDTSLGNKIGITIIATGFEAKKDMAGRPRIVHDLNKEVKTETTIKPQAEKEDNKEISEIQLIKPTEEAPERELPKIKILSDPEPVRPKPVETNTVEKKIIGTIGEDTITNKPQATPSSSPSRLFDVTDQRHLSIDRTISSKTMQPKEAPAETVNKENPDDYIEENSHKRSELLKKLSMLKSVDEYENEPAYRRKNIDLDLSKPSEERIISKYTLGEDDKNNPVIKSDNTYLHGNVD